MLSSYELPTWFQPICNRKRAKDLLPANAQGALDSRAWVRAGAIGAGAPVAGYDWQRAVDNRTAFVLRSVRFLDTEFRDLGTRRFCGKI
jgi:hypothetical protein